MQANQGLTVNEVSFAVLLGGVSKTPLCEQQVSF